jgi:hypothetical protein
MVLKENIGQKWASGFSQLAQARWNSLRKIIKPGISKN